MSQILQQLQWRYATQKFSDKKITDFQLQNILQAVSLTPSSLGLQPWKFIVVTDPELKTQLEIQAYNQKQVTEASHLIVLCRLSDLNHDHIEEYIEIFAQQRNKTNEEMNRYRKMAYNFLQNENKESLSHWLTNQVYIALGTLLTVCAAEGIDSCPMEGFRNSEYDRLLGLESLGLRSVVVVPIGYRSENENEEHLTKVRFDLNKLVIHK